jgi:hypothetical protein
MTKRVFESSLCLILIVSLFTLNTGNIDAQEGGENYISRNQSSKNTGKDLKRQVDSYINESCNFMYKLIPNPSIGTIAGEWTVMSIARSGFKVPDEYYSRYYDRVVKELKEKKGILSTVKYTEYSRVIIALTAIGRDPRNVVGYNLVEKLSDFNKVKKQGINGPIFALIALDTNDYDIPKSQNASTQTTRDKLIGYILSKEITQSDKTQGGWALEGNTPDPDITAMALQSLAKYKDKTIVNSNGETENVASYIDRGISILSDAQLSNGAYKSWGTENIESISQVVLALTALGIDPRTDPRFIKGDGNWALSAMEEFYVDGGGFKHTLVGEFDGMSTDQGSYGLVAYQRFVSGKNKLYDMSDVPKISDAEKDGNSGESSGANQDSSSGNGSKNGSGNGSNSSSKNSTKSNSSSSLKKKSTTGEKNENPEEKSPETVSGTGKLGQSPKDKKPRLLDVRELSKGDDGDLFLKNKRVVAVSFEARRGEHGEDVVQKVYFDMRELVYSRELSQKYSVDTYIVLLDKSISDEELRDIDKYSFDSKLKSEEIIFGDTDNTKIINAQDAVDILSVCKKKSEAPDNRGKIIMDTTTDGKINALDAVAIMDYYVDAKPFRIVE